MTPVGVATAAFHLSATEIAWRSPPAVSITGTSKSSPEETAAGRLIWMKSAVVARGAPVLVARLTRGVKLIANSTRSSKFVFESVVGRASGVSLVVGPTSRYANPARAPPLSP